MDQGILLAGGAGTRLGPLTTATNKHFLPIYDKPLIYYSLTTMILAGIKKIVLVSTLDSLNLYKNLLGDGSQWGIEILFAVQEKPEGIPQAIIIAKDKLDMSKSFLLALGDNLLYGAGTGREMRRTSNSEIAEIFCFEVADPSSFGVAEVSNDNYVVSLIEKPTEPKSNLAIVGFYCLPAVAFELATTLKKSQRGEFEIIELLNIFRERDCLKANILSRGTAWLDAGTVEGLLESSQFVRTLQNRQGLLVGSPDEAAWNAGNISKDQLVENGVKHRNSEYGTLLSKLINK